MTNSHFSMNFNYVDELFRNIFKLPSERAKYRLKVVAWMLIAHPVPFEPLVCSPSGGGRLVHLEGRCTCSHPSLCMAVQESATISQLNLGLLKLAALLAHSYGLIISF